MDHNVKVTFANGDHITTGINGTKESVRAYYLNNEFNLGGIGWDHERGCETETDNMQRAVSVEFLN